MLGACWEFCHFTSRKLLLTPVCQGRKGRYCLVSPEQRQLDFFTRATRRCEKVTESREARVRNREARVRSRGHDQFLKY